jgi:hypothetical protein
MAVNMDFIYPIQKIIKMGLCMSLGTGCIGMNN